MGTGSGGRCCVKAENALPPAFLFLVQATLRNQVNKRLLKRRLATLKPIRVHYFRLRFTSGRGLSGAPALAFHLLPSPSSRCTPAR